MPTRPTITLHLVASLDGFIAAADNSIAWLEADYAVYPSGVSISPEAAAAFVKKIDGYVMGSRTYQHALELGWPYGDTPVIVVTSQTLSSPRKNVEFYSGDPRSLVANRLAPRFRNVWLVGGAMLAQQFLALRLVDEICLTLAPVLLGAGLRLFSDSTQPQRWTLKNVTPHKNGFVELHYAAV